MSRRALRMERHHRRHRGGAAINMISLMDIFTILVFFLLVNSADVDLLPSTRTIELPESIAEERPRETVVVMITHSDILVQGQRIIGVEEAMAGNDAGIPALTRVLEAMAARRLRMADPEGPGPEATVMAARELPYRLVRRVMLACAEADYGRVSFAVLQRSNAEVEG